jgi:diacylglycerol kinase family enzyme
MYASSPPDRADRDRPGHGALVPAGGSLRRAASRWLARLSLALACGGLLIPLVFDGLRSLALLAMGVAACAVSLATAFWFLALRGIRRWLSLSAAILAPIAVVAAYAAAALWQVAAATGTAWLLAAGTARLALAGGRSRRRTAENPAVRPPARPFLIMNPRSGGGKVSRFGLRQRAEAMGARVFLMSGPGRVNVAAVARAAVADGADLLGVAGGDGTQALVAGVAAEHDIPFMVITAGTRNHFALDLGLDLANPAACLDALTDGVELRVDLGDAAGQTFVNNASFGAYAEVVKTPAYRDDKLATTLNLLPELLSGHRGARLVARAGDLEIPGPQAVLVANNPYGTGDIAGLGRRERIDQGVLGVIGVSVSSARQAVGLLRGTHGSGLCVLTTGRVTIDAGAPAIPVGLDGESLSMRVPVEVTVRPRALRVRVPRNRPGTRPPRVRLSWHQLWSLAVRAR